MISRSSATAILLLKSHCIDDPNEINLEDLIYAEGGVFEEKAMSGADGRIVFGREYALVSVNSKISNTSKRRFVIAHEIGSSKIAQKIGEVFQLR